MSPTYDPNPRVVRDPNVAYDPNLNLDPNVDPNLPYDQRVGVPPVVAPLVVEPPTANQMLVFLGVIRRVAPQSARRVVEIIDEFFLHYFPDGLPEPPPEPPPDVLMNNSISSATILTLSTVPKEVVPIIPPAPGTALEFRGCAVAFTFGTLPYVDAGGVAMLQMKIGTVVVSEDLSCAFMLGSANSTATFVPLPGIALQPDLPITLVMVGGTLTGGDSNMVLDITFAKHPPADAAALERSLPPYKFGVASLAQRSINAAQARIVPEDHLVEYQDRDDAWKTAEASGGNRPL